MFASLAAMALLSTTGTPYLCHTDFQRITDLPSLHAAHATTRTCDTSEEDEGYSDAIAKIFTDRWDSVVTSQAMIAKDKGFQAFVLRHVDTTWPDAQTLARVEANARDRCPARLTDFCAQLVKESEDAQVRMKAGG